MDGEVLKVKRRRRRFHSEGVTVFDVVIGAGRKTKQDMVKMNSMRVFASVAMAMGVCAVMAAEKTVVSSPDGKNEIRLYANPLTYEVRFGFNIWKPRSAVDVDHLVKYARERGVDLWHWMAFHQVYGDEERVASHFAKAGIKGFKVDFLDRGDAKEDAQRYVHETRKVKAGENIPLHMAPGGGFVARCSRMSP